MENCAKNSKKTSDVSEFFSLIKKTDDLEKRLDMDLSADFNIIFCGVFSSGKTSLINALLGVDFPVGINPKTHVITEFRYGETKQAYLIENSKKKKIDYKTAVNMVADENSTNENGEQDIHLIAEVPSDMLKGGICFIDTPGMQANQKDDELTKKYLKNADMCIMCFNASELCNMQNMEFLKDIQSMTEGTCIFVLNCMNYLNTLEEVREVRERADDKLSDYGNELVGKGKYFELCTEKEKLIKEPGWKKGVSGFQNYVNSLICEKRLDIKLQTKGAQVKFELASIRERLDMHYKKAVLDKEALIEENKKAKKEKESQKKTKKKNLIEYILKKENCAVCGIDEAITSKVIEKTDDYNILTYNFANIINEEIKTQTIEYFRNVVQDMINDSVVCKYIRANYDINTIVEDLFENGLSVPEPEGTRHERSVLERAKSWWEGTGGERYYYTYNDYRTVAKTTFKNVGVILLTNALQNIFNDFKTQINRDEECVFGGYEDEILEKEIYASAIGGFTKKIVDIELKADGIGCFTAEPKAS